MIKKKEQASSMENMIVRDINCKTFRVAIEGVSPLLCNRFSEEAQKGIEDKQQGKGRQEKKLKRPLKLAESRLYELQPPRDNCKYGIPGVAFKQAIIRAGSYTDWKMIALKGLLFVVTDNDGLVPLYGGEDWELDSRRVVVARGTLDIRHRPRIPIGWGCQLQIEYNASGISPEQIVNLLQVAGFSVGIGDYRPASPKGSGPYGRFRVKETE